MPAQVLVNGTLVGWANCSCVIGGVVVTGINKIAYSEKQKKENIMGAGSEPVGRGIGGTTYEGGELSLLMEEWKAIIAASPGRRPTKLPMFDIPIVFDNGMPADLVRNVEFTENNFTSQEGDTKIYVTVPYIFAGLDR
ncbi:hypothetical protein UFOVP1596_3 [uncultured Caudovirales phage]|uniref:Uncharacterized protein n=1 Tax=uncultured Caudovirales phage TaxID=2100421 RepID=A0A6J5SU94_9CAUD|nr:hypothetical protein UFOVP1596_3 [uncultured Caudovirales phage]